MDGLTEEQVAVHVPIVAWLNIAGGLLVGVVGLFLALLLPGIGFALGDPTASRVLTVVGVSLLVLMLLLAVPGVVAGIGLLRRRGWGRILGIIVSVLNLLNIPIGTIIGGYSLWVLFQTPAKEYFADS